MSAKTSLAASSRDRGRNGSGSAAPPRRQMLKGLLALSLASPAIAACLARDDVVPSTHPALRPTSPHARVLLLGLPPERTGAVRALGTLADKARGAEGVRVMLALGQGAFDRTGGTAPAQLQPMTPFTVTCSCRPAPMRTSWCRSRATTRIASRTWRGTSSGTCRLPRPGRWAGDAPTTAPWTAVP